MSSTSTQWQRLASTLGTSPKQLGLLLASALAALGIFGGKMMMAPKSAAASTPVAAPSKKANAEPAPAAIPETLFHTAPRWNLANSPARSPFMAPVDLQPKLDMAIPGDASGSSVATDLVLQATLDRTLAVVNGKTLRIGQQWVDPKSKRTFQLLEVLERSARLSTSGQVIELSLNY